MNVQKIGTGLLAALVVLTLPASVCRAASPAWNLQKRAAVVKATEAPMKMTRPSLPFVVDIGDAMLEEYRGGDPAARTQLFRSGSSAEATSVQRSGTSRS